LTTTDTNHQETSVPSLIIVIVPVEALEVAKDMLKLLNFAQNFNALRPDGEKSQILSILTA